MKTYEIYARVSCSKKALDCYNRVDKRVKATTPTAARNKFKAQYRGLKVRDCTVTRLY